MKKNSILKLLFLCCLIAHSSLSAQKRRTVAVDSSNVNGTDYRFFPLFYTPPTIGSSDVKLNLEVYTNKLDINQIRVLKFANQNDTKKSIGTIQIAEQDASLAIPLNISQDLQRINTPLSIKGTFTESAQGIVEFNSSDTSSQSYNINKTPRLVVDYELAKEPYGTAWSQMNGNAQHSNQIDWRYERLTYDFAFTLNWTKIKNFDVAKANDKKYDYLSSYKNKPIVFSKGNPSYVLALSGTQSDQELWRTTKIFPGKKPVITPDGKMIYVSEKQTLEVLELNEGKDIASKALSDIKITIKKGETHSINKVTNEITLGYDGTLYMPIANVNGNFGIVALSAYPQLMPRWFYNTVNPVGPVSLSQNEKMVFFIETDITNQKSRLVVLDNRNGAVLTQTEDILGTYANDGNSNIPPVVVQTIDKDTTAVYVLDGNKTSNKLYIFKVQYDQFFDEEGQRINQPPLTYFTLKKSEYSDNKGISQPIVLNNEEVVFGLMNTATNYNIKKDEFYSVKNTNINDNTVGFSSGSGSNYAMILCDDYVFLYSFLGANRVENTYNNGINMYITNWTNAVINQNFSIYVQLKNGIIRQFYHIQENENAKSIALNDIKNKCIYQCTGPIAVTATTVTENTQAIVQGTTISLPRGFTVQKGAYLTFQTIK
jgi:hypothetical protein